MDYSIRILHNGNVIFTGYFTTQIVGNNQIITAFYDSSLPLGNQNVLLPKNDFIYVKADNIYLPNASFTDEGVNIVSSQIQSYLNSQSNHFNLHDTGQAAVYYIPAPGEPINPSGRVSLFVTFEITPKSIRPFWMGSLFTNNAQVYYKPHSFSSGSGGVTNSRAKKRRT